MLLRGSKMQLRHPVARFSLAVAAVALTTWANFYIQTLAASQIKPLPYFPLLIVVTYYAGLGPALLFVVLAAAALDYWWMEPRGSLWIARSADVYVLLFFLLASGAIITVSNAARRLVMKLRLGESRLDAARAAAAAAEQRFRVALEGSSVIVWSCGTDRRFNWIYDPHSSADRVGMPIPGDLPGHGSPEYAEAIERAWQTGRPEDLALRSVQAGEVQHHLAHIEPVKDSTGRMSGLVGSLVDVTQLRAAEEAFQSSEEKFSKAFAASPDALAIVSSRDGLLVEVNPNFLTLFGVARAEAIGRRASEFGFIGEAELTGGARLRDRPLQITRRSGERCDLRVSTETLNVAGRGDVLAIVRDVSEQVRMDASLRESEESLRLALEGAHLGMWVKDLTTSYIAGTPRYYEILGLPPGSGPLSMERWQHTVHPDDLPQLREVARQAIERRGSYEHQFRVVNRDGSVRWVESRARVSYDHGEAPIRLVGILMDITNRKEAEAGLRESSRHKDEFLAILAHELRNPLAPIRYAARMLKTPLPHDRMARAGDMIERQLAHMTRLLDDLLDTSRISRGVLELRRAPLDLRAAIEAAIDATRPTLENAGQTLLRRISASALPVECDRVRLTQAVGNLLDNASKYSAPGTQIEIETRETPEEVVVEVRDHGIGISRELLPHVFELFTQGDQGATRSKGLGIGLALTRQLVTLHGGRIEAHSDGPGHGSRFVLSLPRRAGLAAAVEPAPLPAPVCDGRGMRILIADDNVDGADSLAQVLEQADYSTRVAYDGVSALALAETFRPQIALLDIGLPSMSGLELARRIRAQSWGASVRLIAVTGWAQENDRRKSVEAGFDEHFTKPVDPDQLLVSIAGYAPSSSGAAQPPAGGASASMT